MESFAIKLAYDGRAYHGWQRLKDLPTVQGAVEAAIEASSGQRVAVAGAGRTDRGAHADGQVATFALQGPLTAGEVSAMLDGALPTDIHRLATAAVPPDFHARTSAIGKTYRYEIANLPVLAPAQVGRIWQVPEALATAPMEAALRALVGEHDFASFATKSRFKRSSTVRTIFSADMKVEAQQISLRFRANSFMNHMVRNMVRAVVKVGQGRYQPADIAEILAARRRAASPGTAPASGLYLEHVDYPAPYDTAFERRSA